MAAFFYDFTQNYFSLMPVPLPGIDIHANNSKILI
jgi:hypothetical protein